CAVGKQTFVLIGQQSRLIDLSFGAPRRRRRTGCRAVPIPADYSPPFRYPAIRPGWRISNAPPSIETARVHIAARRGGGVAAGGAGAAVDRSAPHRPAVAALRRRVGAHPRGLSPRA